MSNAEIRFMMKERGVRQWEVAEALGMSEAVLSRCMRHELDSEMDANVRAAIEHIAQRKCTPKPQNAGSPFVVEKGGTIGECTM